MGIRSFEDQEATGRGLRIPFSNIVGIRTQSEVKILRVVLYDSYQPVVRSRVDIRDKTGELPIVVARPLFCTAVARSPMGLMMSGRASRPSHKAFMRSLQLTDHLQEKVIRLDRTE